jgi:DNA-binding FrmR family transcriptional regulator
MESAFTRTIPMHMNAEKVTKLLKTARGQTDGILRMYEDHRYCVDISKQILAVISLLRKANLLVLKDHMNSCVTEAIRENQGEEKITELMDILETYVK